MLNFSEPAKSTDGDVSEAGPEFPQTSEGVWRPSTVGERCAGTAGLHNPRLLLEGYASRIEALLGDGWAAFTPLDAGHFSAADIADVGNFLSEYETELDSLDEKIKAVSESLQGITQGMKAIEQAALWRILEDETGLKQADRFSQMKDNGRVKRFVVDEIFVSKDDPASPSALCGALRMTLSGRKFNVEGTPHQTLLESCSFLSFGELDELECVTRPVHTANLVQDMTVEELLEEAQTGYATYHPYYRSRLAAPLFDFRNMLARYSTVWAMDKSLKRKLSQAKGGAGILLRKVGNALDIECVAEATRPPLDKLQKLEPYGWGTVLLTLPTFDEAFDMVYQGLDTCSDERKAALASRSSEVVCRLTMETIAQFMSFLEAKFPVQWTYGVARIAESGRDLKTRCVTVEYPSDQA
jgi:hypothetical protein